eukprot:7617645-Alexandrium_andersonii.AAC.1
MPLSSARLKRKSKSPAPMAARRARSTCGTHACRGRSKRTVLSWSPVLVGVRSSEARMQSPTCCGTPEPSTGSMSWNPRKESISEGRR